jgi:hypothetical protein
MVDMNEYEDAVCPECNGTINDFGFCEDCNFDYEEHLNKTEKDWKNENPTGKSNPNAPEDGEGGDGWLDIYRNNQRP